MRLSRASIFILGFYVALVLFYFSSSLFTHGHISLSNLFVGFKNHTQYGYIFAFAYGLIPLMGGGFGLRIAKKWGFFKSSMGKAVFFLSTSLISWGIGELIWSFYNFFLNANVPYPSWADAGFILTYPLWGIGMIYLGHASGAKFGLRKLGGKLFLIIVPIIILAFSWYLLVVIARGGSVTSGGGPLKVFFDIAYPVGDIIILTIAFLIYGLSFKYLGGRYKWPIIITLFGFFLEYFADFGFSYTTTINTFYNGCWVDLTFTTALFILSFGLTNLDAKDL